MKYSILINQFKRRNFIDKAVASAKQAMDIATKHSIECELVTITDFDYQGGQDKGVRTDIDCIGYNWAQGLKVCSGDYIFLLDDDDLFLQNKILWWDGFLNSPNRVIVPLPSLLIDSVHAPPSRLDNIIKYHLDWYSSYMGFSKEYAELLIKKGLENVQHSVDKFNFFHALNEGTIQSSVQRLSIHTVNVDSKMHHIGPWFYSYTAKMFERLHPQTQNSIAALYRDYNIKLNRFLAENTKEQYQQLTPYLPLVRKLYYRTMVKK